MFMESEFLKNFIEFYNTDKCIACNTLLYNNVSFVSQVWVDDFTYKVGIYACGSCCLGYTYPFLSDEEENRLYEKYINHNIHENIIKGNIGLAHKAQWKVQKHIGGIFFRMDNVTLKKFMSGFLFPRMFQTYPIFSNSVKKNLRVLDIGCGDGHFLMNAKMYGCFCYGTEVNDEVVQRLKKKGIVATKNINDFVNQEEPFDIVRINHVLEHTKDPNRTLKDIRLLLKDEGELIIGVPNFNNISRILKKYYWLHLPYHRLHFTKRSLELMLKNNGYRTSYRKTKSMGVLAVSLMRKYNKTSSATIRLFDIFISVFLDLFRCGDCIEIYAKKDALLANESPERLKLGRRSCFEKNYFEPA